MSPRAALRLTHFGFTQVYDYVPGKSDWMAAGLPREGRSAQIPNAGDLARADVATCRYRSSATEALESMHANGVNFCVAVDRDSVVVGMVYRDEAQNADGRTVEEVMRRGPTTIRASEPLEPLTARMTRADVDAILVTTPEGRLLGLLDRHHAEAHIHPG
jgi:predicted transcriptional regulator